MISIATGRRRAKDLRHGRDVEQDFVTVFLKRANVAELAGFRLTYLYIMTL
jgi:hypothetical protein